ncbi:hypothetical protein BJX68DRAFT_270436 [Aspergillus pseudodeflectus]|uniref:Uncharacterized protein n=1 Tax=Aspergillus pseudodeflectus TaxID=176178 RepID=A0ABR4JV36_9EURO
MSTSDADNGNPFEVSPSDTPAPAELPFSPRWAPNTPLRQPPRNPPRVEESTGTCTGQTTTSDSGPTYTRLSRMSQPGDPLKKRLCWLHPEDGTALGNRNPNIPTPDSIEPNSHGDAEHLSVPTDDDGPDIPVPHVQSNPQSDADHMTIVSDALSASRREGQSCTLDETGTDALDKVLKELRWLCFLAYIGDYAQAVCHCLNAINKHLHGHHDLWKLYQDSELEKYDHWIKGGMRGEPPTGQISDVDRCIKHKSVGPNVLSHEAAYLAYRLYSHRNAEFHSGLGSYEAREDEQMRMGMIPRDRERLPLVVLPEYANCQVHLQRVIGFYASAPSIYAAFGLKPPK